LSHWLLKPQAFGLSDAEAGSWKPCARGILPPALLLGSSSFKSLLPLPAPRGALNPPSHLPFPSPPKLLYHARALLASSFLLSVSRAITPHPAPHHHLPHKGAREEEGYCVGGLWFCLFPCIVTSFDTLFPFAFSPSRLRFYLSPPLSFKTVIKCVCLELVPSIRFASERFVRGL